MIAWAIVLFVAGMILILAEFIVPGMVCGIIGAIMVIISAGLASYSYPEYNLFIILIHILGVCASIIAGNYLLSRTRAGKILVLEDSQEQEEGWVASESDKSLIDAEGTVNTALRPSGTITVCTLGFGSGRMPPLDTTNTSSPWRSATPSASPRTGQASASMKMRVTA